MRTFQIFDHAHSRETGETGTRCRAVHMARTLMHLFVLNGFDTC